MQQMKMALQRGELQAWKAKWWNAPLHGTVLRYGKLYGPGAGFDKSEGPGWLHVDAAAKVAADAVMNPVTGIFNIAEDEIVVSTQKAQTCLEFIQVGAHPLVELNRAGDTRRFAISVLRAAMIVNIGREPTRDGVFGRPL